MHFYTSAPPFQKTGLKQTWKSHWQYQPLKHSETLCCQEHFREDLVLRELEHQLTQLATKHHTCAYSLLPSPGQGRKERNKALLFKIRRADLNNMKREETIVTTITKWMIYNSLLTTTAPTELSCTARHHYLKNHTPSLASPLLYVLGMMSVQYHIPHWLVWPNYTDCGN